MSKILIILGPTATGKTKLAVHLAKENNGEIISADSRQVYKGMDIVTGKDKNEYGNVPVWGLDLVDPDYIFNVSDFIKFASQKIEDIESRGKLPIIVGGTALYIKSLLEPPETLNIPQDSKLRAELENLTVEQLQERLGENNLNESDFKNPRRLIRAIETKGKKSQTKKPEYDYKIINLVAPLDFIYEKINKRVDERLTAGAKRELESLLSQGYSFDLPSMTSLGYKDIDSPDLWKLHERQYAKRQVTFIKKFLTGRKVIELDVTNDSQKSSFSL